MSLARVWDGEYHLLEPGEHFAEDGAREIVEDWEELEEEDILSPFESNSVEPILRTTGSARSDLDRKRFPNADKEQSWGALAVALTALSMIVEMPKKQYENVNHQDNTITWSFQSDDFLTERL